MFGREFEFYTCSLLWLEIDRYQSKLYQFTRRTTKDFDAILTLLTANIHTVETEEISLGNIIAAYRMCYGIDMGDAPFVALALDKNALFWTGDEVLRRNLTKRGFTNFFVP